MKILSIILTMSLSLTSLYATESSNTKEADSDENSISIGSRFLFAGIGLAAGGLLFSYGWNRNPSAIGGQKEGFNTVGFAIGATLGAVVGWFIPDFLPKSSKSKLIFGPSVMNRRFNGVAVGYSGRF